MSGVKIISSELIDRNLALFGKRLVKNPLLIVMIKLYITFRSEMSLNIM